MLCPECGKYELEREIIEQIEIDRCLACNGIWLDANELERLVDADPKPLLQSDRKFQAPAGDVERLRYCPHCKGARMIKLNSRLRPGTIIDSCSVCHGTWLDAGEFSKLAGGGIVDHLRRLFHG